MERLYQSLLQASRPVRNEPPSQAGQENDEPATGSLSSAAASLPEPRLFQRAEQSGPRIVAEPARSALADSLGPDSGQTRLHRLAEGDELNWRLGADALSAGRRVFYRRSLLEPAGPHGLALIGHERTRVDSRHADQLLQPAPYPATRTKERDSVANELRVLREASERARLIAHDEELTAPPAARKHLDGAPTGMNVSTVGRIEEAPPVQAPPQSDLSESQLVELRERLYRDLIERIRIDQERGA